MKVPLSWLKDYVDISLPVDELAERLTLAGLEVGRCNHRPAADWSGIGPRSSSAQVRGGARHPDADRLVLATWTMAAIEVETVCHRGPQPIPL